MLSRLFSLFLAFYLYLSIHIYRIVGELPLLNDNRLSRVRVCRWRRRMRYGRRRVQERERGQRCLLDPSATHTGREWGAADRSRVEGEGEEEG